MAQEDPYLVWDTCSLLQQQAQFIREGAAENDEELSEEDAFQQAVEDVDFLSIEWSDLCDSLTELMKELEASSWHADVKDFGWDSRAGKLDFKASTGEEMLQAVLPATDCTFKLYYSKLDKEISINNSHHDSPLWKEWYRIRPVTGNKE